MALLHSQIIGSGIPMIILHGFLGMSDNWRTLGLRYAENGFQVHLVDQRNHGHSFHSQDFNYSLMVADLDAYAVENSLDNFILMGHSMGGKTAMLYAATHSEKVNHLIVADIAPKFYPVHHQDILKGLASLNFDEITSRSQADKQLSAYISEVGVRQFLLKNLYWETRERLGLRLNLPALTENVSEIGEALPQNAVFEGKTLFLKGEYSEYVMPTDQMLITSHFPNAQMDSVSKAGHWLHAQNPDEFFQKTINFINS